VAAVRRHRRIPRQYPFPRQSGRDFRRHHPAGRHHASKSEWLFLANAYVDLGPWWYVTPFIGAGIGASRNTISSFVDTGATQAGATILSTTFGGNASQWNLAWALYAGLSYQVNPAVSLEFAYRYVNLGGATTGPTNSFDGVTVVNATCLSSTISRRTILRSACAGCLAAVAPPLIRGDRAARSFYEGGADRLRAVLPSGARALAAAILLHPERAAFAIATEEPLTR
jgi:hypothetical protein